MPRSNNSPSYGDNPDNRAFEELADNLGNLGVSQADLADRLGISAGQVSRIRQGKRQAIARHIKVLRAMATERRERVLLTAKAQPFFSVATTSLRGLGPRDAVHVFRELLWAEALRISVSQSRISVSLNVFAADGGIDASILEGTQLGSAEELLVGSSRYQIKAGAAQPWQRSWIIGEIYDKGGELKSGVRQCLIDGGRYTLVCFGVDLLDGEIRKAVDFLDGEFSACGYPNAAIQVWGQTQITAFLQRFPSLCLALNGIARNGFQCHVAWSQQDDMKAPIYFGPEQLRLVSHIRSCLSGGSIGHIRLLGEPGIGKTRIALEATRCDEIAPAVVYFPDGESFLRSQFLNELAQVDDSRFVVLVIDECRRKDSASIWNRLKSRQDRTRLITVDHDPDNSVDNNAEVISVPPAAKPQITEIICSYNVERYEAERWAAYCEGCPRVAHVVGANLQRNSSDLLSAPATVDIWDRFIVGYDDPASEEVRLRKLVLCYLSLFERFGFEHPVDEEARYISELLRAAEPAITWQRFQGIVLSLKGRRIIQGKRTLYITPRLLHIYLYRLFWENFGRGALRSIAASLPQSLRAWFVTMLPYTKGSNIATDEVNRLLQVGGIFPNDRFEDDEAAMKWIESLAESHPHQTLAFLGRILGRLSTDELLKIHKSRQQLVWALEKLAVWTECFEGAANLLLRLASAENSDYGNNATEVFRKLFSLVPGMAATQASPDVKLEVLKKALASDSPSIRAVALLAIETGLSRQGVSRIVGPEHQGLSARIEFWWPKTYGELWGHYADLWHLLADNLAPWKGEGLRRLKTAIITSAWDAVCIKSISSEVLDTLEALSRDDNCDTKLLFSVITRRLRHSDNILDEDVVSRLESIKVQMESGSFAIKLRRYVSFVTLDDEFDNDRESNVLGRSHVDLANAAMENPSLLIRELPWLVGEQERHAYSFGFQVGKSDSTYNLKDEIISAQENCGDKGSLNFLGGYLASVFDRDPPRAKPSSN